MTKQKIVEIYNNLNIPNWTAGKNVTAGWVNVECPFCDDHSNHCGVNPDSLIFSCWRCGKKGHFADLLVELTGLPFGECKNIISDSTVTFKERPLDKIKNTLGGELPESKSITNVKVELPKRFELITNDTDFPLLNTYLKRRKISRTTLIENQCGICRTGEYMNRLIIPVFCSGKLVSFQGADLSGFSSLKYRSAPLSMGAINNFLYNYDKIRPGGRMIVAEGVLDAWRTGDEAVAAFTSSLTKAQKKLIIEKGLKELYFCFDCELNAYYKSKEEAKEFEAYIPVVEVVKLPFGLDPDELGREGIYQLISELSV